MKNQTNKTEEKNYTKSDIEVILKRIDNRFDDTIGLLTKDTGKKIEKNTSELGSMIEDLDTKIVTLSESVDIKFENVNNKLDHVDNRLELVETKIDRLQDDMVEVKFELKRKVGQDEFEKLEKRVVKLEKVSLAR